MTELRNHNPTGIRRTPGLRAENEYRDLVRAVPEERKGRGLGDYCVPAHADIGQPKGSYAESGTAGNILKSHHDLAVQRHASTRDPDQSTRSDPRPEKSGRIRIVVVAEISDKNRRRRLAGGRE